MTGGPLIPALTSSTWVFFSQTNMNDRIHRMKKRYYNLYENASSKICLGPKFQALWVLVYKKSWNVSEQTLDAGDLTVWGQAALLCSSCSVRPLLCKPQSLSTADHSTQKFEHKHCRATLTENTEYSAYASHVRSFNKWYTSIFHQRCKQTSWLLLYFYTF